MHWYKDGSVDNSEFVLEESIREGRRTLMDNNQESAVNWLERLSTQKARDGLNTQYEPIKGGLLRSSRFGQSMAVIGSAESTPVKGKPTQASAEFHNANWKHLGLPEDRRALGRPRLLRHKDFEILCYEPRVNGLTVDGAHVSLAMASRRHTNDNMLIALKSDVRLALPLFCRASSIRPI